MGSTKTRYAPDYAVHPGEIIAETLEARGLKKNDLAQRIGISEKHLSQILHGKSPVLPETAIRLERVLDVQAQLWLNLNSNYDLFMRREEEKLEMQKKIKWVERFPLKELQNRGFIVKTTDKLRVFASLLDFFNIGTIPSWESYVNSLAVRYRQSGAFSCSIEAVSCWLKIGERIAMSAQTRPFDKETFKKNLQKIRTLTTQEPAVFEPKIKQLCADAGIAIAFVQEFPKTRLSGATFWLNNEKAVIMLSLRYKSNDHFWFTFFHEAGHVLLHGKKDIIIDSYSLSGSDQEEEANTFAADFLIPPKTYSSFIMQNPQISRESIRKLADETVIAPGIIIGRLQKDERLPYKTELNKLKIRYELENEFAKQTGGEL
ncbi:MAG: HigA family addiction module antidote protein [Chitinispirillaceae bacterium]|nr:HigA family addiction module antidote protein [Chitinispirillaceae bacterium]